MGDIDLDRRAVLLTESSLPYSRSFSSWKIACFFEFSGHLLKSNASLTLIESDQLTRSPGPAGRPADPAGQASAGLPLVKLTQKRYACTFLKSFLP